MSPTSLCPTCIACLTHHQGLQPPADPHDSMFFYHHFQPQALQDSASAKCPICTPLWSQLEPLQSKIPYKASDKEPLTMLLLRPPVHFGVERSYELMAILNEKAATVDGIEYGSVLTFLLQDRKGRLNMCIIAQFVYHKADSGWKTWRNITAPRARQNQRDLRILGILL